MVDRNRKNTDSQIYGRLLSYIYPYLFIFFLSICGFAISAAAQVAYAKWLEEVIEFVNNPVQNYILLLPLSLIVITLIRGIGFFVGNYLMARISNNLVHSLRVDLFNKIPVLPTSFFDDQSSGHLVSRITFNVMQVTGAATSALKVLIRELIYSAGIISISGWSTIILPALKNVSIAIRTSSGCSPCILLLPSLYRLIKNSKCFRLNFFIPYFPFIFG